MIREINRDMKRQRLTCGVYIALVELRALWKAFRPSALEMCEFMSTEGNGGF